MSQRSETLKRRVRHLSEICGAFKETDGPLWDSRQAKSNYYGAIKMALKRFFAEDDVFERLLPYPQDTRA